MKKKGSFPLKRKMIIQKPAQLEQGSNRTLRFLLQDASITNFRISHPCRQISYGIVKELDCIYFFRKQPPLVYNRNFIRVERMQKITDLEFVGLVVPAPACQMQPEGLTTNFITILFITELDRQNSLGIFPRTQSELD